MIPPWVKDHWKDACVAIAIALAWLTVRQAGELRACQTQLAAAPAAQSQGISGTAKADVRVIYKQVPGNPCPEVEVVAAAGSSVQAVQEQTPPKACPPPPSAGLWLGALAGPSEAMATADLTWKRGLIGGGIGPGSWQARVAWKVIEF